MFAVAFSIVLFAGVAVCPSSPPAAVGERGLSDGLEELYRSGVEFEAFLASAEKRKETWERHYTEGDVDPNLVARATAVPGTWRILAIAEDSCSDSVSTIPFLALLAERAENVELRVIDSNAGSALMSLHRTPDGRGATPTVLVLDEAFEIVGCWVERPSELQTWALGAGAKLGSRAFLTEKMAWYEADGGRSTVAEIVTLIERAAADQTMCPTG